MYELWCVFNRETSQHAGVGTLQTQAAITEVPVFLSGGFSGSLVTGPFCVYLFQVARQQGQQKSIQYAASIIVACVSMYYMHTVKQLYCQICEHTHTSNVYSDG